MLWKSRSPGALGLRSKAVVTVEGVTYQAELVGRQWSSDVVTASAVLVAVLFLAGCSMHRETTVYRRTAVLPKATATIQDIMEIEVDPSADALWDAVTYVSTFEGTVER